MKKYILGFSLFVFSLFFITNSAFAATIFTENFGSGSTVDPVPNWIDGGISGTDSEAQSPTGGGNDTVSPDGGRFAKIYAEGAYICKTINTTGYNSVQLSYYWRGDNTAENSDYGIVEIKPASGNNCNDVSGWTQLQSHDMSLDSAWNTQSAFTNIGMNNSSFLLRFRANSSFPSEDFRVDGILISGTVIATTGSLQITKTAIGGNSNFSFTGDAGNFNITTVAGIGNTTRTNLTPGTYSVSETAQAGWDMNSNTCTSVVITAGNTANCTIANTKRGSVTVYKDVVNPNGDVAVDGHWFGIKLNDANPQSISEFNSYTYTNLVPGTYTVTEGVDGDYDFMSFSVDSDSETSGAQITVLPGANTNLTITNKQKFGSITVNKTVTNPNGGEAVAGNFYFSLNGGEAIQFIQNEMNSLLGQVILPSVNPGAFSIAEVMIPSGNYAISYSGNCNGLLESNGSKTCNITNSDIPEGKGAITVVKNVINDDGGMMVASDFPLYISPTEGEGMMADNGVSYFLDPGTYNISEMMSESLSSKYTQTSLTCMNGETETSGQVVLSAQASWVCTITNNDKPAKLTIVKNIINDAWNPTLTETFTFSLSGHENMEITTLATEESEVDATGQSEVLILNAGDYTLSENLLSNWSLTGMSCTNEQGIATEEGNGLLLSLSNGEEVTCTFTNTRKTGILTVNKIVINDHAGTNNINDFSGFQVNGGTIIPFNSNEEESAMESHTIITLESGVQYDITEPETSGYDRILENNCRDINVDPGMNYICDITNNDNAPNTGGSIGGDPTPFSPSTGSVLGASTEIPTTTETPKEEEMKKEEGKVLGEEIFKFLKNMKLGSRLAPDVIELQKRLTKEGFYGGPISGYFGPLTKDAVIKYQTKYSPLTTDGVVGPRTRGVLNGTSAPLPNSASI